MLRKGGSAARALAFQIFFGIDFDRVPIEPMVLVEMCIRDRDHIDRLEKTPELFEKYLPYAMALRVEKKWVAAFSGIALEQPQWYSAPYGAGFQPIFLVNDLNFMSSQAGTMMASSPRSSGGSRCV